MFRKTILALTATAAIGAAALAPTSASAFPMFPHPHPHWGHGHFGWFGGGFYDGDGCVVVRRGWHRVVLCD